MFVVIHLWDSEGICNKKNFFKKTQIKATCGSTPEFTPEDSLTEELREFQWKPEGPSLNSSPSLPHPNKFPKHSGLLFLMH